MIPEGLKTVLTNLKSCETDKYSQVLQVWQNCHWKQLYIEAMNDSGKMLEEITIFHLVRRH